MAIAEPYNGGSYGGQAGEACGECWEIATLTATRIVMVHDLCPIEGNPLCAGGYFHFDLSSETAQTLHGGGLDEASARRVACPVSGNVHLQILDRNQWGYLRFAVVNHRIPVRWVEYRSANGTTWQSADRSGGAWHIVNGPGKDMFAKDAPGGVFRITSAQGEQLETSNVLDYSVTKGSVFNLGVGAQLTDQAPTSGPRCEYEPPAVVYGDSYGGIDQVRWKMNPWGSATAYEVSQGCYGDSGSCIRVDINASYSGFHIYYVHDFATHLYQTLTLRLRALSGSGNVNVAPSSSGSRCQETTVAVGSEWSQVTIDLAAACTALDTIGEVTMDTAAKTLVLLLDDIRFEKRAAAPTTSLLE